MSLLIRTAQRTLSSSFSWSHVQWLNAISCLLFQSRAYSKTAKSPFESNILRILHNGIDFVFDYVPSHQPVTKFDSFVAEDRVGEQWMTMRRKFHGSEDIKIEVTMFDGYVTVPRIWEDSSGEDVRLHISVLVDVSKRDGSDALEFVCSAWRMA